MNSVAGHAPRLLLQVQDELGCLVERGVTVLSSGNGAAAHLCTSDMNRVKADFIAAIAMALVQQEEM
jgi:hypothetical protein